MTNNQTDFRALCAELLDVIDSLPYETNYRNESRCVFPIDEDVVFRARAALQQPESEGPTDEEIADEARKYLVNEYALPAEITYLLDSDNFEYEPTIGCFRAVLARWGRPSIKPVSLSERLPGPEDCDAEGRCWYFFMDSVIGGCGWQMFNEEENQQLEASHFWLPHYALPVPTLCDEENK